MPAKDYDRWQQNEDGSWSRRNAETEDEIPAINATVGAIEAAAELGIDIYTIDGTGKDGKITKKDVEDAA